MSVSLQAPSEIKLTEKTYFAWADKLWYIVEVDKTGECAFIEDCKTERVRWVKTALFVDEMREVIIDSC